MSTSLTDSKIATYLEAQRSGLIRLDPKQASERLQENPGAVLIDTRPASFRDAEGSIPGAIIIERYVTILTRSTEWSGRGWKDY